MQQETCSFADPRANILGWRCYDFKEEFANERRGFEEFETNRIKSLIPETGIELIPEKSYILEFNFEKINGVDFKKGCYIGQENTARMKLKNKLRRRLLPISSTEKLNLGEEIFYDKIKIGKILIEKPYPFGLVKLIDPNVEEFQNKELLVNNKKCKILKSV